MADPQIARRQFLGLATLTAAAPAGLITALASAAPATRPATAAVLGRLRVLTYNIHHGEGLDRKLDLDRIARTLRETDPDLVALQEVDRVASRSGKVDQAARLGELTGLHAAFGEAMPFDGGGYGNAILSRWKLDHPTTIRLPSSPKEEPRCLLVATVSVPGASGPQTLRFGSTHLNHRSADERMKQVNHLLEQLPATPDAPPTVVAGDFNATPDSDVIRRMAGTWLDATRETVGAATSRPVDGRPLLSFPADQARTQIDYVFATPAARWSVVRAEAIPQTVASDHLPVLAELVLA